MAVAFSDTTNKNGLIQICERLTHLGDAAITGDATVLAQFTAAVNDAYDEVLPYVFASDGRFQWDDLNHTDLPIATTDVVSGQRTYSFTSDSNGNSILTIQKVSIRQDSTTSDYTLIRPIDQDDPEARQLVENNTPNSAIPFRYDKLANVLILDPTPDYSSTAGLKIQFSRTPNYFTSADTTQTPGIPDMFHSLLAFIASHEWVFVNEPNETTVLNRLEAKINERKIQLSKFMNLRSDDEQRKAKSIYRSTA